MQWCQWHRDDERSRNATAYLSGFRERARGKLAQREHRGKGNPPNDVAINASRTLRPLEALALIRGTGLSRWFPCRATTDVHLAKDWPFSCGVRCRAERGCAHRREQRLV